MEIVFDQTDDVTALKRTIKDVVIDTVFRKAIGDTRAITYCGGGIAASSTAFVMTRLGRADVAVYTASLQEWAADPANPMVVDTP